MYLRVGGKTRPFNEARVSISYAPIYDAKRTLILVDEFWEISGRVILQTNATQSRMTAALRLLSSDFSQKNPSLVFLEDDGVTESFYKLNASDCIEGPEINANGFPTTANDVYATGVTYTVNVRARRRVGGGGSSNPILEFNEQLSNPDGGRVLGFVGGAINFAELQVFQENAPYTYIQSGSAVGLYGHPAPPPPLWPQHQLRRNKPVYLSPRKLGQVNTEYETQWSYEFGHIFPLIGKPHEL